jgi:Arm DNA-binding domain
MRAELTPALVKAPLATSAVREEMRQRKAAIASLCGRGAWGFGLMLMASGSQSYVIWYRHHGKSPRMSLSAVLDLTTARKKAKAILGEAAQGPDWRGAPRP